MADYPYCTVPGKLSEFLRKIQELGVPNKATTRWLPTIGFTAKNDRSIIPILKFVGLVSSEGKPSQVWTDFRGTTSGRALGKAVTSAYSELFETYPDAPIRSTEDLQAFFRGHSSYGAQAVGKAVGTFKALCQHSEFDDADHDLGVEQPAGKVTTGEVSATSTQNGTTERTDIARSESFPSLHINIQIHISPEASTDQIEKIFDSISKHLYKGN